jgi:uncharacterized protein YjbI with pentapeptide repeats
MPSIFLVSFLAAISKTHEGYMPMAGREFVNPYPGTIPFQDRSEDRLTFFGRDREVARLADLVLSQSLVILFARSGLGKSSLINAGLLEKLRDNGCIPVVARVTHNIEAGPVISIFDRINEELRKRDVASRSNPDQSSLWAYFESVSFSSCNGTPLKPVLILDQFEELFTRLEPEARAKFIDQLAEIARGRVPQPIRMAAIEKLDQLHDDEDQNLPDGERADDRSDATSRNVSEFAAQRQRLLTLAYGGVILDIKIVISMREDFLAELEALKEQIPLLLRNTMRLEALSRTQAREAIVKPSQQREIVGDGTVDIAPAAVDAMLNFLSGQQSETQLFKSDEIEPVQLQILCHSLYERARGNSRYTISVNDLGGHRGMSSILRGYYNNVVRKFPNFRAGWNSSGLRVSTANLYLVNLPRLAIRSLCEEGLILASGFRNSLEGGYIGANYGVPERDLVELVDQRLLRSESRQHGRFYELSHDSLIGVLKRNRMRRRLILMTVVGGLVFAGIFGRDIGAQANQLWTDIRVIPYRRAILNATDEQQLSNAVNAYLEVSTVIDLSGDTFHGLTFEESKMAPAIEGVKFSSSTLKNCTFVLGVGLKASSLFPSFARPGNYKYSFTKSIIDGGRFDGSRIHSAVFDEASISNTTFLRANLQTASFRGAKLTGVDFSGSSLGSEWGDSVDFKDAVLSKVNFSGTSMQGTDFSGVMLDQSVFTGAAWWLAQGWTDDQMKQLERQFPHADFVKSDRYSSVINTSAAKVERYRKLGEKELLAEELNRLAWHRSIVGVELPEAEREIDEALSISGDSTKATMLDTKAYVLMQRGDFAQAKHLLAQALGVDPTNPTQLDLRKLSPDIVYRYALTFDIMGEADAAKKIFAMTPYQPTHERSLVPKPGILKTTK